MQKIKLSRSNTDTDPDVPVRNLASIAFERIRSDIVMGKLKPDERLRINNLSERYEVGPTAIREALSRLVTDGMVMSEDQRGFCVAPVSRDDIIDLTQTRIDVEGLALTRAIEQGDVEWESNMLSAFHRLSKCPFPGGDDVERKAFWSATHLEFHRTLISGCRSSWLMRLCSMLYDRSERYRNLAEKRPASTNRDVTVEHKEMMEAALARDAVRATKLLADHFWGTTNIILLGEFAEKPGKASR